MVKTLALQNMQDARRCLGSGAEAGGAADGTDEIPRCGTRTGQTRARWHACGNSHELSGPNGVELKVWR